MSKMIIEGFYYISLPEYTIGINVENGTVIEAPPIARWTKGKRAVEVFRYFVNRGGTYAGIEWQKT